MVACLVVLAGFPASTAVAASPKPLKITKVSGTVTSAGKVPVRLACTSKQRCRGTVQVTVAGVKNSRTKFSVVGKHRKTVQARLSARQTKAIAASAGAKRSARVVVRLTKPRRTTITKKATLKVKIAKPPVVIDDPDHHGHTDPVYSRAYLNSWKPSAHEQGVAGCTVAEHNSYAVTGVDGKLYPGWHPAVHTRGDGSTCTFGHEHGDDPRASDIDDWVVSEFRKQNPKANGIPFGYGSEQLSIHAEATGSSVHRHEDDPGHKVIVSNDQQMGQEFRDANGVTRKLVCDVMTKVHQGSWSSDATKNNVHELVYAVKCNDGTEVLSTTMSSYGSANELHASCTRPFNSSQTAAVPVTTIGSTLPDGEGGMRLIPTKECIEEYVKQGVEGGAGVQDDLRGSPIAGVSGWWWAGYEQWQSYNSITDAEGKEIARYEPWFGIQNPARYYAGNGPTDTVIGYLNDLAWEAGNQRSWSPWAEQIASSPDRPVDAKSPDSWFDGTIRDAWLAKTLVKNKGGSRVLYADPWGHNAQAKPFTGSVRLVVSASDNSGWIKNTRPSATRRFLHTDEGLTRNGATGEKALGFFYDYGTSKGQDARVHAPN